MYKVAVEQSDANKITPAKGDTLASIAASDKCEPGTTWQRLALYNWGSVDPHEVNRALIELVGCSTVDAANPEKSVLDPDLGTTKALHIPKEWKPGTLAVEKTHTVKVRKRLPAPAAVLTKVDPWFIPETETCDVGFRIEGVVARADKLDFDVYASNYCKATPTADDGFFKYAFAPLDIPIRQKRAVTEATLRKAHTITDWKGESEAKDGMLKPRADDKKRYVDVACSPYTVLIRYYKGDGDKDAKITLKPFWPRFKKVFKDKADTTGIDGAATGLKEKTEAAVKAARDLEIAIRKAEADVDAFVKASERAALRAHSASKAANRAIADVDAAKLAADKAKTDVTAAKVAVDNGAVDANVKEGTASGSVGDAKTKTETGYQRMHAAATALGVAKAAAAKAAAKGTVAKASATDAATKAETAKTKADEAKSAATEPKDVKDAAEAAAKQAATAKTKADELKAAATAASTSADTCRDDAATASTTATGGRDDAAAARDAAVTAKKKDDEQKPWNEIETESDTAKTNAGTAKTKAGQAKTQAATLQKSAHDARIDAAKLAKAMAPAKKEAAALLPLADTTDDHVVYDKSLEVSWKIEKTANLKHGQLLILDKAGNAIFRKPLAEADLEKDKDVTCKPGADDHAKYWLGDKKTKLDLLLSGMPYRVQLQAHSTWDQAEGLAVVAMHTEVRLWAHKDIGTHVAPVDDSQSLHLGMAPWRPDKDPPASGTDEWYKLKLAEAGFHPGPVNTTASAGETDPFQVALGEFQRSFPKEEVKPFTRLVCDGTKNGPTKDVLERTDVADKALTKSVDIKAKTKATLDAADPAKAAAEKGATDALAAQTEAVEAARLADEAATAANQAATDADAVRVAVEQAKADVEAAADAKASSAADAGTKASTAQLSAGTAATKAATAVLSATQAATKTIAAKQATETAATKAATAKTSTDDTATKVATAKTKADEAKEEAKNADPSVKDPAGDCATKAATAETSANTAKASGVTAGTSADASKAEGLKAETAANRGKTDADTLKSAADLVLSSAQSGDFAQARGHAGTAATHASTAKASTAQAKTDVGALKTKADQAKIDADKIKTDADQAKTDATALALAAKTADDAAELDRTKKKKRKDDLDKIFRPAREMFGNPSDRADYTRAEAMPLLGDKSKALIVWVDDRHYYTERTGSGQPSVWGASPPDMAMRNYRDTMRISDGKILIDQKSVARPWIPLEAHMPLLAKAQTLDASGAPPAITDAMRRAIGPLRVDWTFEELPPEVDHIPEATVDVAKIIAAYDRAVSVKAKTAAALVAAGPAKTAAEPPVTKTTAAQTELGKLVTAVGDSVPLVGQGATDVAAAQTAADKAKVDVDAAQAAAASAAADAGTKADTAKASCADAATKAATAVQSTTSAAAKVAEAKTAATAMATEAGHAKTETAKLVEKIDAVIAKIDEADLAAGVAASAGAVTGAIDKASKEAAKAKKSADTAKADAATAETSSVKCKDEATTADTAAQLAKSKAEAIKTAADLAKGHADTGTWASAKIAAATAATEAGLAKTAADQAKADVGTLKASTDKTKPEVDKTKTDADEAKPLAEAIEPETQTADTEAENDRVAREAAATNAGANVDPAVAVAAGGRARTYLTEILGPSGMGKLVDGKLYANCPASTGGKDYGGIRPDPLDDYYKAPFGLDKTGSIRPWLAIDDTTNKIVCSVAHDDLGQPEEHVFAANLGKAGVFLNPSRIAGDGYRYRAQVSFMELPAGASHPNREALLQRYVRPPAAHTAGLRIWRKAALRGYARWMNNAVAGWQDTLRAVAAYYAAAHVHFIYEGPAPTTPVEFTPVGAGDTDLMTAAEFKQCVEAKLSGGGTYAGMSAVYTAGYVWPYLDQVRYATSPESGDLDALDGTLRNLENDSWDLYSMELIHKLIEGAEKKHGRMRGHTVVEFHSSPPLLLIQYECDADSSHKYSEVSNDPGGASSIVIDGTTVKYTKHADNAVACTEVGCGGTYVYSDEYQMKGGFPLCAIGRSLGGCWQFTPRDAWTWAHEIGHHRHFQHAQASHGDTTIAPGGQTIQHDSQANVYQASADSAFQRAWDRWCLMSYDDKGAVQFCGKCLLKNRGWRIEAITNPVTDIQDG